MVAHSVFRLDMSSAHVAHSMGVGPEPPVPVLDEVVAAPPVPVPDEEVLVVVDESPQAAATERATRKAERPEGRKSMTTL